MTHNLIKLRDHKWQVGYSSDQCDLITEFYEPAMAVASNYNRAVGYFSSLALALISRGIQYLYLRNGKMRLIASPALSVKDREAIKLGVRQREEIIEQRLLEYLDPVKLTENEHYRLQLLTGMIADGLLEVRIAVKEEYDGSLNLYHEKIGVFIDAFEDYITFIGSPNESWNGWVGNAESFALHKSWNVSAENAAWEKNLFETTWNGERKRVPTFDIPSTLKEELFDKFPPRDPNTPSNLSRLYRLTRKPETTMGWPEWLEFGKKLRDYQRDAVNAWIEANGRGIFAMATGTGKTVTALSAAIKLVNAHSNSKQSLLILVIVPSQDLVTQWYVVSRQFNVTPVCCHSGRSLYWPKELKAILNQLQYGESPLVEMVITTAGTLVTGRFQTLIAGFSGSMLAIGDEVHSLGTEARIQSLPNAQYRLGLSATPRRHGDEIGTEEILAYFGEIIQRIDIKQAIDLGALVPYSYHPILVDLDSQEMSSYRKFSAQLAAISAITKSYDDFLIRAGRLLTARSRLLGHAQGKMDVLREMSVALRDTYYNLIYVAEGTHPIHNTRQLLSVADLLGNFMGMRINIYTSDTPSDERTTLQLMLRDRRLQALVAMRCLDEGIDIPEARTAIFMASTRNPRQFVQRRGRILRRDDNTGKTHAELFDLLVVPNFMPDKTKPGFSLERNLVGRELSRALELASASQNNLLTPPDIIVEVMKHYELLELLVDYNVPTYWDKGGDNVYQ